MTENALRIASPSFASELGDGFAIGIREENIVGFLAGLALLRPLSVQMEHMTDTLADELAANQLSVGTAMEGVMRFVRISRELDYVSHAQPRVIDCDSTKVLAVLAAITINDPRMLTDQLAMLEKSGVHVKMTKHGNVWRLTTFGESLDFALMGAA